MQQRLSAADVIDAFSHLDCIKASLVIECQANSRSDAPKQAKGDITKLEHHRQGARRALVNLTRMEMDG